ncbi:MAG: hypothetical protein E7438_05335 [Ruminococcaceae bacterium]|nr:hypothetical protein [Oscillospiraceae bacterium]
MKKTWLFLLLSLFLSGCAHRQNVHVTSHIVTEITITCETCTQFTRRYYNTHEKMQQVLLYLRAVSPGYPTKEDPEPLAGRVIYITLHRADGTRNVYRQKDNRFLQQGGQPWRQINQDWGASLYRILLENESDPELGPEAYRPLPGSWRYRRWVVDAHKKHPG